MALLSAEIGNAAPGTGLSGGRKVLCLIRFTLTRVDRLSSSIYLLENRMRYVRKIVNGNARVSLHSFFLFLDNYKDTRIIKGNGTRFKNDL